LGCEEERDGAIAAFLGRLMERRPRLRDEPLLPRVVCVSMKCWITHDD